VLHRAFRILSASATEGGGHAEEDACRDRGDGAPRNTRVTMALAGPAASGSGSTVKYEPHLDPSHFVSVIDNPYYPLPVGRTLVYKGVRDGLSQIDRVHVTNQTKVLEGITATAVRDVATHNGTVLEATTDWFAQDDQGNVWYLGEDTKSFENGKVDTSGSWQSGVNDGEPGDHHARQPADPRRLPSGVPRRPGLRTPRGSFSWAWTRPFRPGRSTTRSGRSSSPSSSRGSWTGRSTRPGSASSSSERSPAARRSPSS
jgi:hypothetical protein